MRSVGVVFDSSQVWSGGRRPPKHHVLGDESPSEVDVREEERSVALEVSGRHVVVASHLEVLLEAGGDAEVGDDHASSGVVQPHEGRAGLPAAGDGDDREVTDGGRSQLEFLLGVGREGDEDGRLSSLRSVRSEFSVESLVPSGGRAVVGDVELQLLVVLEQAVFAVVRGQLAEALRVEAREVGDLLAGARAVDGDDLGRSVAGRKETDEFSRVLGRVVHEEEANALAVVEVRCTADGAACPLELMQVESRVETSAETTLCRLVEGAGRTKLEECSDNEWYLGRSR